MVYWFKWCSPTLEVFLGSELVYGNHCWHLIQNYWRREVPHNRLVNYSSGFLSLCATCTFFHTLESHSLFSKIVWLIRYILNIWDTMWWVTVKVTKVFHVDCLLCAVWVVASVQHWHLTQLDCGQNYFSKSAKWSVFKQFKSANLWYQSPSEVMKFLHPGQESLN